MFIKTIYCATQLAGLHNVQIKDKYRSMEKIGDPQFFTDEDIDQVLLTQYNH
jgi:hypothetical protein